MLKGSHKTPDLPSVDPSYFSRRLPSHARSLQTNSDLYIHFDSSLQLPPYHVQRRDFSYDLELPHQQGSRLIKMSAKPVIDINVDAAKLSSVTKIKEATTLCSDGDPKQANRRFQAVHNIVQDFVKRHAEDCATTPRQWNKPFWQQLTSTLLKESSFIRESFSSTRPGFDTRKHFSWPEDKIK